MTSLVRLAAIATATLSVLAALCCGAVYGWLQHDLRNVEISLEWLLSDLLDRELEIGQLTEARLGENTRLVARQVTLANPAWAEQEHFASASYLVLEIDIPSLWRDGPVLIHHVELEEAALNLQQSGDLPGSWNFWPERDSPPAADDSPLPVVIANGTVATGLVRFLDDDRDITAQLDSISLADSDSDMLALEATGNINGVALSAHGRAGPARALFTGRQLQLDLALAWGDLTLKVLGSAGDLKALHRLDAQWSIESPESLPLLELLGAPEVRDGPLFLDGIISSADTGFDINARGTLEAFGIAVSGNIGNPLQFDDLDLRFDIRGPSLHETGTVFGLQVLPDVHYTVSGSVARRGNLLQFEEIVATTAEARLTVSGRLPDFPSIDDWQVELQGERLNLALLAPALGLDNIPEQPYEVSGRLSSDDDGVELLDVRLANAHTELQVDGLVGQGPSHFGTQLQLALSGEDISETGPWIGLKRMPAQPFQLSALVRYDEGGWQLHDGRLRSADLDSGLVGTVDRLVNTSEVDAELTLSTPDMAATLAAYGVKTDFGKGLPGAFSGHVSGTPGDLHVSDGKLRLGESTANLSGKLGGLGKVGDIKLNVSVDSPDLRTLYPGTLPGSQPLHIRLATQLSFGEDDIRLGNIRGSLPGNSASFKGNLVLGSTGATDAIEGALRLSGKSTHKLRDLLGIEYELADDPLELVAEISGRGGRYQVAPLTITAGKSDLSGRLDIRPGKVPEINATLHSDYLYLPFLVPDLEELEEDEKARIAAGEVVGIDNFSDELSAEEMMERLIPDEPLQLAWLRNVNGSLTYSIDKIFIREGAESKGSIALELNGGRLAVTSARWYGTYSAGDARAVLDASTDDYAFDLSVEGEHLPLLWLLAGEPDHQGDSMYRVRLSGQGNTPRQMAASLNGAAVFRGTGGRVDNRGMDLIVGDLVGEIFDSLNPTTKRRRYTDIVCHAGAMIVEDGVVEAIPGLILRSEKTDYLSAGMIDLNSERLDMAFSTRSRKGLGISAGRALSRYVKLGGTLANPRLNLDATAAAVSGSAAIATAGWSILASGIWDRWVASSGDPCKRLIKQARKDPDRDYRSLLRRQAEAKPEG